LKKKSNNKSEEQEITLAWLFGQEIMKFSKASTIGVGQAKNTETITNVYLKL